MNLFRARRTPPVPAPDASSPSCRTVLPEQPPEHVIDLLARAYELANDDWTEQEAALELARVADFDHKHLLRVYGTLVGSLVHKQGLDVRAVRAGRIVSRATRLTRADTGHPSTLPPMPRQRRS